MKQEEGIDNSSPFYNQARLSRYKLQQGEASEGYGSVVVTRYKWTPAGQSDESADPD